MAGPLTRLQDEIDEALEGGETSAAHLAWLCPYHHSRIDGWHLERRGGRVWCTAPPWLDPTQTPRLNSYFHPPELINDDHLWSLHPAAPPADPRNRSMRVTFLIETRLTTRAGCRASGVR
jgi:hypothetical protein